MVGPLGPGSALPPPQGGVQEGMVLLEAMEVAVSPHTLIHDPPSHHIHKGIGVRERLLPPWRPPQADCRPLGDCFT